MELNFFGGIAIDFHFHSMVFFCFTPFIALDTGHVWSSNGQLTVAEIIDRGDWGSWDTCPTGSYAAGISLSVNYIVAHC